MEASSKSIKLKLWHKIAIVLFVILSSLFVLFLSLRVNWVEPVDLTGFRFEPLNQNPPLEEMPEDAYIVKLMPLMHEFEKITDDFFNDSDYEEEHDERYNENSYDDYAPIVSLKNLPHTRRLLKSLDPVMDDLIDLGSYHDFEMPGLSPDLKMFSLVIMEEYIDYMLLTAESGDVNRFEKQFKSLVTFVTAQQREGFLINELVALSQIGRLVASMESFEKVVGDKVDLAKLLDEGYNYYLKNKLPFSEILRGEYFYSIHCLDKAYESWDEFKSLGASGDYEWLRDPDGYDVSCRNMQFFWKGVISHFEKNPNKNIDAKYSLKNVVPYREYLDDYGLYFVRDAYGYIIQSNIAASYSGLIESNTRTNKEMDFMYTYLSVLKYIRRNKSSPKELKALNNGKIDDLVRRGRVYYTYFSDLDWYITGFDPALLNDIQNSHEDINFSGDEINEWNIRHATKSVRELFEGPAEEPDP